MQIRLLPCYGARIAADIRLKRLLKVALDCGHGVTGSLAPALFEDLGCEVTTLFGEMDDTALAHRPDPSDPQNLKDLIYCLRYSDCEVGLAFDATATGWAWWPSRVRLCGPTGC